MFEKKYYVLCECFIPNLEIMQIQLDSMCFWCEIPMGAYTSSNCAFQETKKTCIFLDPKVSKCKLKTKKFPKVKKFWPVLANVDQNSDPQEKS